MMWHCYITQAMAWDFVCGFAPNPNARKRVEDHVAGSEHFVGVFWHDKLVAVYGSARPSVLATEGYIWLQVGPEVGEHRVAFARNSLEIVNLFFEHYTELVGVTDFDLSQRWLEWLGAKFVAKSGLRSFIFRRPHG